MDQGIEQGIDAEDDSDDDFNAGYESDSSTLTTTPDDLNADEPVAKAEVQPEAAPAPKLANLTEEQYQSLLSKADSIDSFRAEQKRVSDTLAGNFGKLRQDFQEMRSSAPNAEVSETDFAQLREFYPELATIVANDMKNVVGKMRGPATPAFDPSQVEQLIQQRLDPALHSVKFEYETKLLNIRHPDAGQIRDSEDFKKWGQSLPLAEWHAIRNSDDSSFVSHKLDAFKAARAASAAADKAKAAKTAATRQTRIATAVAPRGTGGHAAGSSEDDDFNAGFNS